ncbi:hypothetical protein IB294_04010 [Vibrio parahaemolyticus]|nr:hypothetical protein [Vibrio parahaemolyticus]
MIRTLILTLCSRIIAVSGSLLLSLYISNFFGVEKLGAFSISLLVLNGCGILSRYGMDIYYIKYGVNIKSKEMNFLLYSLLIKKTVKNSMAISLLIFIIGCVVNELEVFSRFEFRDLFIFVSILPFFSISYMCSSYYKAAGLPSVSCFFEVGMISFLTVFLSVVFMYLGAHVSFDMVIFLFLCSSATFSLLGTILITKDNRNNKSKSVSKDENQTNNFFWISIIGYFQLSIFTYICTYFLSLSDIGVFKAIERVAMTISFVLVVLNSILMPKFSYAYRCGESEELVRLMRKGIALSLLFTLPIVIIISAFPEFVLGMFGDEFKPYVNILWIMCLAQWINVLFGSVGTVLNMTNFERDVKRVSLTISTLTILILPYSVYHYGLEGAAYSYLSFIAIQNIFLTYFVSKRLDLNILPMVGKRRE